MILRPEDPRQMEFLCRADLVAEEPLVQTVDEVVNRLDLTELYRRYSEAGRSFYDPAMQLKVLFFGYCDGVRVSRELARHVQYDIRYRYFAGSLRPDFRTINRFRQRNLDILPSYFAQIVALCEEAGLVDVSVVALDGTKIRASASSRRTRRGQRLDELATHFRDQLAHDMAEDETASGSDEAQPDPDAGDHTDRVEQKVEHVPAEAQQGPATDPDARFMKTSDGVLRPCYNAQIVADNNQLIIAADVSNNAEDSVVLRSMIEQSQRTVSGRIEKLTADGGYYSGRNLKYAKAAGLDLYSPIAKSGRVPDDQFGREAFEYDPTTESYRCPAREHLRYCGSRTRNGVTSRTYRGSQSCCGRCRLRRRCTTGSYRSLQISEVSRDEQQMRAKLSTVQGKAIYGQRKRLVEPVFGNIKFNLGFARFGLRTLPKVRGEFLLICIAHNLKKLAGWWGTFSPIAATRSVRMSVLAFLWTTWAVSSRILRPISLPQACLTYNQI